MYGKIETELTKYGVAYGWSQYSDKLKVHEEVQGSC